MFQKILVPIDGSENSMRALDNGLYLASKLGSHLSIIYVLEIPPFVYIQSQKLIESIMTALEKEANSILNEGKNKAESYNLNIESIILEGNNIGSIILEYSEENKFDCIIIGSRGRGSFKHAILGSVSHRVLHHSKNPVLIVK